MTFFKDLFCFNKKDAPSESASKPDDGVDTEKAKEWVKSKFISGKCEICESKRWSVEKKCAAIFILNKIFGGSCYPKVIMICESCGNTKFFNAVIMGLKERSRNEIQNS